MIPEFINNPDPSIYLTNNYITLDLETTNLDKGSAINEQNRIVLGVAGNNVFYNSGELKTYLYTTLIETNHILVAHNAKFELQWLKRLGLPLEQILVYDTMLAEYVLAGNKNVNLSLGAIAKRRGFGSKDPFIDICMKGGICPSEMPKELLERRCIKDVEQTESIFLQQREELNKQDKLKTLYTRCIFTPVLADIEFNGLYLDGDKVEATYRDYTNRFEELEQELGKITGGINLRSPKQKAEFLYDTLGFSEPTDRRGNPIRTPSGGRRTDSDIIRSLKASNQRQREFIKLYKDYNKLSAAISKNLDFFHGVVREYDNVFYGQFNQSITQTHRLSSSGRALFFKCFGDKSKSVQFQNLPRQFKSLFTARKEGWKVGEIDGAQLEFRVAAHLGKDAVATDAIRSGFDVHSFTAQVLTENGEETTRQEAKAHTFKPLYGGRSGTRAQQAYYGAFRERYKGISSTQQHWIDTVLATKKLTIPSGLEFFWPDTKLQNDFVINTPSICNYPVQSYATADIIPIAVTKLWHDIKANNLQSFLINTIHDSAIMEVHPDEEDHLKDIGFKAFTEYVYTYLKQVYNDEFTVPLGAEFKLGSHWSTGEETLYSMEPPHNGD